MYIFKNARQLISVLVLVLILTFTAACGANKTQVSNPIQTTQRAEYGQLAKGNSAQGQDFGEWVIQSSQGLIKDVYVRDNNKLGVVITPKVLPTDVKTLAQSLAQGFRHNFPNQDLMVLVYAPDKKLILTARYDTQSKQIEYQQPT
jgi:hypothetical protein